MHSSGLAQTETEKSLGSRALPSRQVYLSLVESNLGLRIDTGAGEIGVWTFMFTSICWTDLKVCPYNRSKAQVACPTWETTNSNASGK